MSTALTVAPARKLTTPDALKLGLGVIAALSVVFGLTVIAAGYEHRHGLQTVARDAAPSIVAAQAIKVELAAMHAYAADALFAGPGRDGPAVRAYEAQRAELSDGLLRAAGNITYGDAERIPLLKLMDRGRAYEGLIAQARVLRETGGDPLPRLREADRVLHEDLYPAADALDAANRDVLDRVYHEQRRAATLTTVLVVLVGLALLAVLVVVQVFLRRRVRRRLNPGLLVASALAFGFLVSATVGFVSANSALRITKEDAFESIHTLWKAKADAADTRADDRLALLDRERSAEYAGRAAAGEAKVASLSGGLTVAVLQGAVAKGEVPSGFQGHLAVELRNITFLGEQRAAADTLIAFLDYTTITLRVRQLATAGKSAEAVAMCQGDGPAQAGGAYRKYVAALDDGTAINDREFHRAADRGFGLMGRLELFATAAAIGVALLAYVGLRPRMREYDV
jgi:hypothetical protein